MLKNINKKRIFFLFITVLIAVVIFSFSTIECTEEGKGNIILSTIYHFGIFFMFSFFLLLTIKNKQLDKKTILIVLLISLTYAISDEFHQLFVFGRFASLKDVLIDFAGSVSAVLLINKMDKNQ